MAAPIRLQTHVWNPVGDRRALLLHGLTSDGATWWRLASELADEGWMVLAPDLRSHGRSPTGAAHDVETLAGDVALLGEDWELVVGHSLGGAVAAALLARSSGIEAAVLVDPALHVPEADRDQLREMLRAEAGPQDPARIRAENPAWDERDVQRKALAAALVSPDVVDAVFDDNGPWDLAPLVARWSARVHLVAADPAYGGLLDPALADTLADGRRITAEVVPGTGHSIHRERPEVVSAAVRRVIARS